MAEIDDGAALLFRTIQPKASQLSAHARDALNTAFDGKKVSVADARLFFDFLSSSDHPGDTALSGVIADQNIVFTTKKKTVKLKSDPAQRHPAHAAVEAALSRVPSLPPSIPTAKPEAAPTTKSTVKKTSAPTAGKLSTQKATLKSLLAKLSSASARRKAVRTAGRTGLPQPV